MGWRPALGAARIARLVLLKMPSTGCRDSEIAKAECAHDRSTRHEKPATVTKAQAQPQTRRHNQQARHPWPQHSPCSDENVMYHANQPSTLLAFAPMDKMDKAKAEGQATHLAH